jgi:glycosyltransferase involved in cell wall biosynthesis
VERTIAEYGRALSKAGHEPVILNTVRKRRALDEYWFACELKGRLRREQFDVLHASTPVVANRLAALREPFVYTSHSRHWFDRDRLGAHWGYFLERRAVRRSAGTVALTDRLQGAMRAAVHPPPTELLTIPIGVDLDRFRPDPSRRTGTVALGVGVVAPFKRWHVAAAGLRGTGATLRIVGPTPDPAYVDAIRAAGDRVEILGEVDEAALDEAYASADFLVHPSRVELLAGVVLQGLSAGLPILGASSVSGLAEEGVSGWTAFEGADEAALTRFVRDRSTELMADAARRRSMGEAARTRAMEKFSWSSVVERHLALYRRLGEAGRLTRAGSRRR